jgi:hypothetical protein
LREQNLSTLPGPLIEPCLAFLSAPMSGEVSVALVCSVPHISRSKVGRDILLETGETLDVELGLLCLSQAVLQERGKFCIAYDVDDSARCLDIAAQDACNGALCDPGLLFDEQCSSLHRFVIVCAIAMVLPLQLPLLAPLAVTLVILIERGPAET